MILLSGSPSPNTAPGRGPCDRAEGSGYGRRSWPLPWSRRTRRLMGLPSRGGPGEGAKAGATLLERRLCNRLRSRL
jgi:hypothetical protein